jgi:soluble lytic murein transglycosylase-like protein
MADIRLSLPLLNSAFYKEADKYAVSNAGKSINSQFQNEISQASRNSNIDPRIITAIIFIESKGIKSAVGGKAIGLMQIDPTTADEAIWMENNKKRLNDQEKVVLRKVLGSRLDTICKKRMSTGAQSRVTKSDLFNPAFNIQIGAIYLGLLIDEHIEAGQLRLDKVILRYNRGYYFKPANGTPEQVYLAINKVSKVAAEYVLKIAGRNNVIDLLA